MKGIVVVGSLNADLVATVERHPGPGETVAGDTFAVIAGGKGANQAYAAARLGAPVAMMGRVGDDAHGRMLREKLATAGVDVTCVSVAGDVPTGTALITVDAARQNRIVVVAGANAALTVDAVRADESRIRGAAIVLAQLETPLEAVTLALRTAKSGGAIAILDPAPARRLSDELLRCVDYLTPNQSELALLAGTRLGAGLDLAAVEKAARSLLDRGVGKVVAKLGADGALLVDRERSIRVAVTKVEAVDTTAAGDCFNGAFAAALHAGRDEAAALRFACAAAALSVTRFGAQPSMPTAREVESFVAARP